MDWRDELFKEKSLLDVYRVSPSVLGNTFNFNAILIAVIIILLYILRTEYLASKASVDVSILESQIINLAALGLNVSVTILGFLLAGFAIFSTVTRPELFQLLAKTKHKNSELSNLKYSFFSFMNIFINYLGFISFCLVVLMIFDRDRAFFQIVLGENNSIDYSSRARFALYAVFFLLSVWIVVIIIKLKVVIWNIYQVVLLTIADSE